MIHSLKRRREKGPILLLLSKVRKIRVHQSIKEDVVVELAELLISKKVSTNLKGRDFIVADLHGCYSLLIRALKKVNFDRKRDRLFALGDLIDRGEESLECLSLLDEPWFYSVLGNHEWMMVQAMQSGVDSEDWNNWMLSGGSWFKQLDEFGYQISNSYLETLANLPVAITLNMPHGAQVGLCHAEPPSTDWSEFVSGSNPDSALIHRAIWGRDKLGRQEPIHIRGVDATFHGHSVVSSHTVLGNMHFVDTGAHFNQRVQLIELNSETLSRESKAA